MMQNKTCAKAVLYAVLKTKYQSVVQFKVCAQHFGALFWLIKPVALTKCLDQCISAALPWCFRGKELKVFKS